MILSSQFLSPVLSCFFIYFVVLTLHVILFFSMLHNWWFYLLACFSIGDNIAVCLDVLLMLNYFGSIIHYKFV